MQSLNTKSPTIKRILREAQELSTSPSADYHAAPLESNLFEWHFTLRGPPEPSPFAAGIYHGRIILPPTYPLRPPSFRFLTPSGRFEVNREICLSISGHHEESWQPAWGLRTALVALRSFMETEAKGQVGGVEATKEVRQRLAKESKAWKCHACGSRSNEETMHTIDLTEQQDSLVREAETVPAELSLGYRDELGTEKAKKPTIEASSLTSLDKKGVQRTVPPIPTPLTPNASSPTQSIPHDGELHLATTARTQPQASHVQLSLQRQRSNRPQAMQRSPHPPWIDKAITGVAIALGFLVLRKLLLWVS